MAQIGYKGVWANKEFPPYTYVEYPKVIRDQDGKEIGIAQDARHELSILADAVAPEVRNQVHPHTEERDKFEKENAELKAKLAEFEAKFAGLEAQAKEARKLTLKAQKED